MNRTKCIQCTHMHSAPDAEISGQGGASRPLFAWQFVCVYCNFRVHSLRSRFSPHTKYLRFKLLYVCVCFCIFENYFIFPFVVFNRIAASASVQSAYHCCQAFKYLFALRPAPVKCKFCENNLSRRIPRVAV